MLEGVLEQLQLLLALADVLHQGGKFPARRVAHRADRQFDRDLHAVLAPGGRFHALVDVVAEPAAKESRHAGMARRQDHRQVGADRFLGVPAEGQLGVPVPAGDPPRLVGGDDGLVGVGDHVPRPVLAGAQRALQVAHGGDVPVDPHQPDRRAVGVAHDRRLGPDAAHLAGGPHDPELGVVGRLARQGRVHARLFLGAVGGVQARHELLDGQGFAGRAAEEGVYPIVPYDAVGRDVPLPNADLAGLGGQQHAFGHRAIAGLVLGAGAFGRDAGGDVDDGAEHRDHLPGLVAFAIAHALEMADLAVGQHHAGHGHLPAHALLARQLEAGALRRTVVGVHGLEEVLGPRLHAGVQAVQGGHMRRPVGLAGRQVDPPVTDAGDLLGQGGHPRHALGAFLQFAALGHVAEDVDDLGRPPVGVAHHVRVAFQPDHRPSPER